MWLPEKHALLDENFSTKHQLPPTELLVMEAPGATKQHSPLSLVIFYNYVVRLYC